MLVAIPVGIVTGWVLRGNIDGLAGLRLRWAWLAVAGLAVQAVLFTERGMDLAGNAVPPIYVVSTLAVFAMVARNIRVTGMPVVALGSLSNLAAIVANGGVMPADPDAIVAAGLQGDYANSVALPDPDLRPLTDIFAIPAGVPLANVFSVGDVLIALGIVIVIAAAMRRSRSTAASTAA
jgi:hypothetical protein